jgi:hypothetical protein
MTISKTVKASATNAPAKKKELVSAVKTKDNATKEKALPEITPVVTEQSLYKSTREILNATVAVGKKAKDLQLELQRIAVSVIIHLETHKDIRIVRNFWQVLPTSIRRDALVAYFDKYAAIQIVKAQKENKTAQIMDINNPDESKIETVDYQFYYDKSKKNDVRNAMLNMWWKAKSEPDFTPVNYIKFLKGVESFIKRAEKRLSEGANPEKGDFITPEQLKSVQDMMLVLNTKAQTEEANAA